MHNNGQLPEKDSWLSRKRFTVSLLQLNQALDAHGLFLATDGHEVKT